MTKAEEAPIFKGENEVEKVDTSNLTKLDELTLDFDYTPAEITIQHKEEFETAIKLYQEKYSNYVVTEQSFEDDKKVRASLRRLVATADSLVKEKLQSYNKPLNEVKQWVSDLTEPITVIVSEIDKGIKEFDAQEEQKRIEAIKATFLEVIEEQGSPVDPRLFDQTANGMGAKKYFMADNKRVSQATKKQIIEMVQEETKKQEVREKALVAITDACARADLGSAPYLKHFENGVDLADVLEMVAKDRAEADAQREKERAEAELNKRIAEFTAIAKANGLQPDKYVQLLKNGESGLAVNTVITADIKRKAELEAQKEAQILSETSQNSPETQENVSEYNSIQTGQSTSETQPELNSNTVRWQGDFRVTFPDSHTAKLFGGQGGLYEQYGVVVEKLSDWTKL